MKARHVGERRLESPWLLTHAQIPAVLHEVQDNFVQKLLHQCRSDPQVLHCLRREVGQLGLPKSLIIQRTVMLAEKAQVTVKMGCWNHHPLKLGDSGQFTCSQSAAPAPGPCGTVLPQA